MIHRCAAEQVKKLEKAETKKREAATTDADDAQTGITVTIGVLVVYLWLASYKTSSF